LKTFDFGDHFEGVRREGYLLFLKHFAFACAGYDEGDKQITSDPVSNHGLELAFALNAIYQLVESFKRYYSDKKSFNDVVDAIFTLRGAKLNWTSEELKIPYIPYAFLIIANLRQTFMSKDFRARSMP
jgi:hypothetical protein